MTTRRRNRLRDWAAFLVAAGSAASAVTTLLQCAQEQQEMQAAVQALAEIAFR